MLLKDTKSVLGYGLIAAAFTMAFFSMWQLNMLTAPMVDGDTTQSINVFLGIEARGYTRFRDVPWTINVDFFPHMTAGQAYDWMMIANVSALPVLSVGVYLVASRRIHRKIESQACS